MELTLDKVMVELFSLAGIIFSYWFFLMKKDNVVAVADSVDIIVEGGYSPSTISIPQEKTTKIDFFRKDPSSCLEVNKDFTINVY